MSVSMLSVRNGKSPCEMVVIFYTILPLTCIGHSVESVKFSATESNAEHTVADGTSTSFDCSKGCNCFSSRFMNEYGETTFLFRINFNKLMGG